MKLKVKRIYNCPSYCIGRLYVDGVLFCDTLEDTDRGLTSAKSVAWNAARKVPGATAIPKGTYNVTLKVRSPKFGAAKYKNQYGRMHHSGNRSTSAVFNVCCSPCDRSRGRYSAKER